MSLKITVSWFLKLVYLYAGYESNFFIEYLFSSIKMIKKKINID